jgi:hypothetical protein
MMAKSILRIIFSLSSLSMDSCLRLHSTSLEVIDRLINQGAVFFRRFSLADRCARADDIPLPAQQDAPMPVSDWNNCRAIAATWDFDRSDDGRLIRAATAETIGYKPCSTILYKDIAHERRDLRSDRKDLRQDLNRERHPFLDSWRSW